MLDDKALKAAESNTIKSACFGCLPVGMIDNSIIILFASMLGASEMISMVTTSLPAILGVFLLLPFSSISNKYGYKRTIIFADSVAFLSIALLASAPFFPQGARQFILLISVAIFGMCLTLYTTGWLPLLDSFLTPERRSGYFGKLRFSWQLASVVFFSLCGALIGEHPPILWLQIIILLTGLALFGRIYYIKKTYVPEQPVVKENLMASLSKVLENKPLCGFAVYICFLYLAAFSTLPLTYIYLNSLGIGSNIVVILSSVTLTGSLIGYLLAGKIINHFGVKKVLLFAHFTFALINLTLFLLPVSSTFSLIIVGVLLCGYGFALACSSVSISSEMMLLATPGYKAVSMAFFGTFNGIGMGGARFLTSGILGAKLLAPKWSLGSLTFTHFQTLFLMYAFVILFVTLLLVLVPAIFPKGNSCYCEAV